MGDQLEKKITIIKNKQYLQDRQSNTETNGIEGLRET